MALADRLDPTLRRLAAVWLRHPARLAAVGGALVVLAASRLGLTWVVKLWAEGPATTRDASNVPWLLTLSIGLSALLVTAVFVARYAQASLDQRVLADLRQAIASRLLRSELQAVRVRPIGDILSRLAGDLAQLVGTGDLIFRRLVGDLALGCGALALMVWLDPGLTVLILLLIPLSALALGLLGRRLRRRAAGAQASAGALHALFGAQLRGLATIKAATAEGEETRRFAVANEVVRRRAMRGELLAAVAVALVWLLTSAAILAVVGYGTSQVVAGRTTPGGLLAFALLAAQVVEPLRRLAEAHANLQRALAAAARVFELVDLGPLEAVGGRQPERPTAGSLRLERVGFSWPPRAGGSTPTPVLAEVGLTIPAGSQVALVGASGAGKSTLASLLIRLVEPDRGRVLLDGVDLRSLDLVGLRRAVCLVDQEPFIFAATVAANLAYGSEDAARASIVAAAELVGLGPWLASLPAGLDTPLREAGIDLSGGQRQRIALARAVLREPAVLVLDEVTSALDGELEAQIFDALADWLAARTVVVIAHRLATVRRMARVVVLDGGTVVADGSLAEVLTSSARARALFAPQLAGEAMAATPTAVLGGPLGIWPDDDMGSRRLRPVLWT